MPSSTDNGSSWRDNCGLDVRQRERAEPGTGTQTQRGRGGALWYGQELAARAITRRRSGLSAPFPRPRGRPPPCTLQKATAPGGAVVGE